MSLIAILDERAANRAAYAQLARSIEKGARIVSFGTADAAIAWLADSPPDLLLLGLEGDAAGPQEPDAAPLDGVAALRRFRGLAGAAHTPVIVISPPGQTAERLRAMEAGATDFLASPVDAAEFLTRSRNVLRLARQQRVIEARSRTLERRLETSRRSSEKLLRDSREALAQVIDTVPAFISAVDRKGRRVFVNAPQAAQEAGLEMARQKAEGAPAPETRAPGGQQGDPAAARAGDALFSAEHTRRSRSLDEIVFRSGKPLPPFEEQMVDGEGREKVLLTAKSPLRDSTGRITSVLTTSVDITDRKLAARHLQHVASHDELTDLPNRTLLHEKLRRALARGVQARRMCALLVVDLDRFKDVNDQVGRQLSDRLLQELATRMLGCTTGEDTVARLGADEFAILQTGITDPSRALLLARQVVERIGAPVQVDGEQYEIGASIGIAISGLHGTEAEELLRNADVALFRAKKQGRRSIVLFARDLMAQQDRAAQIRQDLRRALRQDELMLHYQPQLDLRSGRISGVEALVRWAHPRFGLLPPLEFLTAAEEAGLGPDLDGWVLRRACQDAVRWQQHGLGPIQVGVNLSPERIGSGRARGLITGALDLSGLDPSLLELELTERDLVEDLGAAAKVLDEMRGLGVQVAIDDFGTGYASFSYVKRFPVSRLKIDQSFVRNLKPGSNDEAIVKAIVNLAHGLHMTVVAEGAETAEQFARLANEGCDTIQGFYVSRPLPFDALVARLLQEQMVPSDD